MSDRIPQYQLDAARDALQAQVVSTLLQVIALRSRIWGEDPYPVMAKRLGMTETKIRRLLTMQSKMSLRYMSDLAWTLNFEWKLEVRLRNDEVAMPNEEAADD